MFRVFMLIYLQLIGGSTSYGTVLFLLSPHLTGLFIWCIGAFIKHHNLVVIIAELQYCHCDTISIHLMIMSIITTTYSQSYYHECK